MVKQTGGVIALVGSVTKRDTLSSLSVTSRANLSSLTVTNRATVSSLMNDESIILDCI